jgi:hypothetical protein
VQDTLLAQEPDSCREREPGKRGEDERLREAGARQPDPNDKRESGKADAAHGGAERIDGSHGTAAIGSVVAGAGFVLFFVGFNEACAGGENGGKGQKESADDRADSLGDLACEYAHHAAECEADDPFMELDPFDGGEPGIHDHVGYLTTSQNMHDAANHTGIRTTVAASARGFKRSSIQLTQAAYSRNASAPQIIERASRAA